MSPPISTKRFRTLSSSNALSSASLSLSSIGRGTPFGVNKANHGNAWSSGRPASFVVGTFGSRHIQLLSIRFDVSYEFLEVVRRKVLPCHYKFRHFKWQSNRLKVDIRPMRDWDRARRRRQ